LGGVTGDIELAGEGTFECDAGGVGSWGTSVGVGYDSTDDLRDEGTEEVVDGGDGGAPGPKDGIAVGILLVLGLGCAKGPEEGAGRV
jgi:hypothetical protein